MQDTKKPKRGTEGFLKHLYCVLTHDKIQCLQWDTNDDSQFIWHGHNDGLLEYIKTKRGRFNVTKEDIFRKKLVELSFLVCEQRVDCHQGFKCAVYRRTSGSAAFFRGMCIQHAIRETMEDDSEPQRKRRRSDASPSVSPTLSCTSVSTIRASEGVEEIRLDVSVDPPQLLDSKRIDDASTGPSPDQQELELSVSVGRMTDCVNVDEEACRFSFSELSMTPLTPGLLDALYPWFLTLP